MPLRVARRCNPLWRVFRRDETITMKRRPIFGRGDRFFLMGSCFAEEIRKALEGVLGPEAVAPDYRLIAFDPDHARVDELPERNHLNFYNAFTILQELRRATGRWHQDPDDVWEVDGTFQDPYRRLVVADTRDALGDINQQLDRLIATSFEAADHFVFTFGMTEVFANAASGLVAAQRPGYGGGGGSAETTFRRTSFAENYAAVEEISTLIAERKPEARIFVTVSPVPLERTFSSDDIYTANMLSKSTLRAVLGEAEQRLENIVYVPSYEAVMSLGSRGFKKDYRHVRPPYVRKITQSFVDAFMEEDAALSDAATPEVARDGVR